MVMNPADQKDDPTYVKMHSASQANVLKDKLAVGTAGGGTLGGKTFTNSPNPGEYFLCINLHNIYNCNYLLLHGSYYHIYYIHCGHVILFNSQVGR